MTAVAVALLSSCAERADGCSSIRTTIVTEYAPGVDCTSPVGVCTGGTVGAGSLAGVTRFTALTITPGTSPDLLFYTGELVLTTDAGTVTLRDHGILDSASARYFELQQIVAGTGAYADARGMLTSQGVSTATGFQGDLNGAVCVVTE